jgi:hypothetical protein
MAGLRKYGLFSAWLLQTNPKLSYALLSRHVGFVYAPLTALMTRKLPMEVSGAPLCSPCYTTAQLTPGCIYADRCYVTTERTRDEMMSRIETADRIGEAKQALTDNGIIQGRLCCEKLGLRMGDSPQQWYGLFPSDRMHLWWEGIAKHMLTWLCDLIKLNAFTSTVSGTIRDFDIFIMQINTRHSDHTMPTFHFNSGVSELKGIPASRMIPLWIQIQVVLGCSGAFLTAEQHIPVHAAISMLLSLGHSLHVLEYSETDICSLELQIRRCIPNM